MKYIVKEREKKLEKEQRKVELIFDAVRFFDKKTDSNMKKLDGIVNKAAKRVLFPSEMELAMLMEKYDDEKYINGEYD